MPEIPSVLPGEVIQSAWGNLIRDRTLQRYADQTELDISVPTPVAGEIAWLGDPGAVFVYDGTDWARQGASPKSPLIFSHPGDAEVTTGTAKYLEAVGIELSTVASTVGSAPSDASLIIDVMLNGVSIFPTSQKPTIAPGATTSSQATPDTTTIPPGAVLTVNIDQVGSTEPGADLTVMIGIL